MRISGSGASKDDSPFTVYVLEVRFHTQAFNPTVYHDKNRSYSGRTNGRCACRYDVKMQHQAAGRSIVDTINSDGSATTCELKVTKYPCYRRGS